MVGRDPARSGPAGPPQEVRGRGTPMDCPRSHGKAVDCAARTGVGRGRAAPSPPAHSLSTGPQGAPALRACPQASHILGRWLETASRSPHFLLPSGSISIKLRPFAGPRRALRCGSRFVHSFLKVFSPPGGPGKWGADQDLVRPSAPPRPLKCTKLVVVGAQGSLTSPTEAAHPSV